MLAAGTAAGGGLCGALGLLVMVVWLVRSSDVPVLRDGRAPTQFDCALALTITGIAVVAVVAGRPRAALVAGVLDTLLGTAALLEIAVDHGTATHPGKMGTSAATCLAVVGVAMLAWRPWRTRRRPLAPAAAGSVVGVISATSLYGYATGGGETYGWQDTTTTGLLNAAALFVLALSMLGAAWPRVPARDAGSLPGWLPLPAGTVAFGAAAAVWLAITQDGAERAPSGALALGVIVAGLVALTVRRSQQAAVQGRAAAGERVRRAAAEAVSREGERRLARFLDTLPVGIFIALPGGRPYYANRQAELLLGRAVAPKVDADGLAEEYRVYVAGTDTTYPTEGLPVVLALGGDSSHFEDIEIHRPDEVVIPLETWGRPVYGTGGTVDYGVCVLADISERKAKERTIARQAALLELSHDAILMRDAAGRITYWNEAAERTYGFTRAEALGRISWELLHTEFPAPRADIETVVYRDGSWAGELGRRCADGRRIIVETRWAAAPGTDAPTLTLLESSRDITARREAENTALRRSELINTLNATLEGRVAQRTRNLQQANESLEAFAYSVAHDLRTPLRAISGYAEILVEDYGSLLDEAGRGYAQRIQTGGEHMSTLIDELLDLARVTRAEIKLEEVDLSAEVTAILADLRRGEPARQVRVTVQPGARAVADRRLIHTVLVNLLENAWKFTAHTDDASIEFGTLRRAGVAICCYVRDNGAGFDSAYAGKLFRPFQRLHDTEEFPGTGIGLASVRRIVERHGGRAWAEGETGHGATFSFTLDAKAAI